MHGFDEAEQVGIFVLFVNTDTALHGDRNGHGLAHRGDALADPFRIAHQAGAKRAGLHAIAWATAIEIDLVVTEVFADARRFREQVRFAAAQLQDHRMFDGFKTKQMIAIPMDRRIGMHHLGVQARMWCQQAMKDATGTGRPFHHRGNAEPPVLAWRGIRGWHWGLSVIRRHQETAESRKSDPPCTIRVPVNPGGTSMATIQKRGERWRAIVCIRGASQSKTFATRALATAWAKRI